MGTTISNLRCEHCVNPLGVEAPAPRLSWCMETARRGASQRAYRILVASSPAPLAASQGDLWDSGRVESDASVLIPYTGRRLPARQDCWWQVQIWDEQNQSVTSAPAFWKMGLLNESDWKAQWIAAHAAKNHPARSPAPLFRKTFRLKQPIASAWAYVSGLGFHEFYLNGRKVGDAVLQPAFTKYDLRALYTVHDITAHLQPGENAAGIMLGSGWYHHHAEDVWDLHAAPWCDECKAIVQIEILHTDGSRTRVYSDSTWRSATGPILEDGLRNGETYDATAERPGWCESGPATADWPPVRIARPPGGVLRSQLMPPCRVTATLRPATVKEIRAGVWLFDLGRNITGWARLTLSGPAGTRVTLRYAEQLGADGDIDQTGIAGLVKTDRFQTDCYILKGAGVEIYEPRFTYHGFQYVQVTGLPGAPTLDTLAGRVVHTDLEQTGSFHCSNDLLNRIQEAALAATTGNYHGLPTDCPHREKNGWTGDAHLSAEQVLYNFQIDASYAKWLDDFTDCQRASGALPGIVPTGGWGYNWGAGPAWDSAYILIPWYLYLYRGDVGILRRHYAGMQRYLDFLAALATDHIVHFGLGDWCPPSPGPNSHKAPAALTNSAYYYADTVIVARIAAILGKSADARRYTALAQRIKRSVRRHFCDDAQGRLSLHNQTALACFLYQGLTEPEETASFAEMLLNEVAAARDHIDCGILGTKYVLHTLTEIGRADVAYRMATQRDYPSWGHWIDQGATTLWEMWNGEGSRNHHMFSDISAWFYKTLAGILPDPAQPGFKHVIIKPWPVGDLTHAAGEIHTPYGRLRSAWRREENRFLLDLAIPPNSQATVFLPTANAESVRESDNPVAEAQGVTPAGSDKGRVRYALASGHYHFQSDLDAAPDRPLEPAVPAAQALPTQIGLL